MKEAPGFILPTERARRKLEFDQRRIQYFEFVNGERRLQLGHGAIKAVKHYGNEVLDGKKIKEDGSVSGLRIRAKERNAGNQEMLEMGEKSIQDLVAYTKEKKPIHYKKDTNELLLPHDYAAATAGNDQWGQALFYHDAPLLVEGILASDIADKVDYARGMVENFVYLIHLKGYVPNGTSDQLITRSQPPSLTQMAWRVYEEMQNYAKTDVERSENTKWLETVIEAAEIEFIHYWKNKTKFNHYVEGSTLITPGDIDVGSHDTAERETGRDMSSEYLGRAHDFQDPNINGNLIGYAWDIALFKRMTGKHEKADEWEEVGDAMAKEMRVALFDGQQYRGLDKRKTGKLSVVDALTGYLPMAVGIPTSEQAQAMVDGIDKFRGPFGLSHVVPETVPQIPGEEVLQQFGHMRTTVEVLYGPRQWGDGKDNIPEWPIETHNVIKGFTRYGYYDEAISIAEDWLVGYTEYYNEHKTLPEKRNVLTGANGHGVEYPQQVDFGWSIANYLWVLQELPRLYELRKQKTDSHDVFVYSAFIDNVR